MTQNIIHVIMYTHQLLLQFLNIQKKNTARVFQILTHTNTVIVVRWTVNVCLEENTAVT